MNKKSLYVILLLVILYFASTVVSYYLFSSASPQSAQNVPQASTEAKKLATGQTVFDQSLAKTEACPINGVLYSKAQRSWWEKHRPLGVMIENHPDARPQSGLSYADAIYEAVAEGGITRFLAIFYCQDAAPVGPVRSARTYFVDFASEYGDHPLYVHVGGANASGPADALGQLTDYGWTGLNDMNQFSIGFPTFWRDYNRLGHEVATEHTMYSTTTKLWDFAKTDRSLTNVDKDGNVWDKSFVPYSFKDEAGVSDRGQNQTIHLEFWQGYSQFFIDWQYDPKTNVYKRSNGGSLHIDKDTNKQLVTKNVIVLYMAESNAHDGYENNIHLLYQDTGTGKARIFMDGKEIIGTWKKKDRLSRTIITDAAGNPVKFDGGKLWFEILPTDGVLTIK